MAVPADPPPFDPYPVRHTDAPRVTSLFAGTAFGPPTVDSAPNFVSPTRLMGYAVHDFEIRDTAFDSHLIAAVLPATAARGYRRIDDVRRHELMQPRSAIVIPQGAVHDSVVAGPGAFVMVALSEATFRHTCDMLGLGDTRAVTPAFPDQRDDQLATLLLHAAAIARDGDPSRQVELDTCLHRVALRVVAGYSSGRANGNTNGDAAQVDDARGINFGLTPAQVQRVTDYINAHLADRIVLDDLARLVSLSRHHFLRQFQRATGRTPTQYLSEQRLAQARAQVTTTHDPLFTIAVRCGFATESHFTYRFRQRYGVPPSRLRQAG